MTQATLPPPPNYLRLSSSGRGTSAMKSQELSNREALESVATGRKAEAVRERWRYLVARPDNWRRQLFLKGRNLTVGQLVSTIGANNLSTEQASENLDLPREAIEEALDYYAKNRPLIEAEASAERNWLRERGYLREPPTDLP
jgi:uncharacterized protein (DUF433 family)